MSRFLIRVKAGYASILEMDKVYKVIEAGFVQWGQLLLVKRYLAERACEIHWPEEYKVSRFGEFANGKSASYFNQLLHSWSTINPTFGFVME